MFNTRCLQYTKTNKNITSSVKYLLFKSFYESQELKVTYKKTRTYIALTRFIRKQVEVKTRLQAVTKEVLHKKSSSKKTHISEQDVETSSQKLPIVDHDKIKLKIAFKKSIK